MPSIATTHTKVLTRTRLELIGDTKRSVEGTLDCLRYMGIVTDTSIVTTRWDKAARMRTAEITLTVPLNNAQATQIRSW